jgi:hypothetical protein
MKSQPTAHRVQHDSEIQEQSRTILHVVIIVSSTGTSSSDKKSWTLCIKLEGDNDQQHREVRVRYVTASVHSDTILYDLLGIQLLIYYHRRVSAVIPNTLFEDTDNMKHSELTVHELISRQVDAVERIPILLHTQKNTG